MLVFLALCGQSDIFGFLRCGLIKNDSVTNNAKKRKKIFHFTSKQLADQKKIISLFCYQFQSFMKPSSQKCIFIPDSKLYMFVF